jgi:nucleoside-diphosphate-sugar epimerase
MSKKVLVLGASGEIGGRIARGCVDAGYQVTGVTRGANARHQVDLSGIEFLVGDKYDEAFYESELATREFDVIIDSVPFMEDAVLAHKHFAGRIEHYFVCGSTGSYTPLQYIPGDENHPWREDTGINFFEQCERDAQLLAWREEDGFPATVFRSSCICGIGRCPIETWGGRNPHYYRLMKQNEPLEIPGDGKVLLQAGCNDDIAAAFVLGAGKGDEIAGEIFNISARRAVSLTHWFNTAKDILGSTSTAEYMSLEALCKRRPDDASARWTGFLMEHMAFDMTKAEEMLGYKPQYTMEQGLERALSWLLDAGQIT